MCLPRYWLLSKIFNPSNSSPQKVFIFCLNVKISVKHPPAPLCSWAVGSHCWDFTYFKILLIYCCNLVKTPKNRLYTIETLLTPCWKYLESHYNIYWGDKLVILLIMCQTAEPELVKCDKHCLLLSLICCFHQK